MAGLFVGPFFALVGLILLAGGLGGSTNTPIAGGVTTRGTVTASQDVSCSGCTPTWAATVSFTTASGARHTFTGQWNTPMVVGQQVQVDYDPTDPASAALVTNSPGSVAAVVGGVVLTASVVITAISIRGWRKLKSR